MLRMFGFPGRVGVWALWVLLGVTALPAYAQIDRGTILGRVSDQSGAVVPNAKVEAIHLETSTVTAASTNQEGLYTIPNLPVGTYQVLISKDGFSPATGEGVTFRAGVQIRVDLVLQPAGVTEVVAVRASNLDSSAISNSTALNQKLVEDLPVIVVGWA